MSTASLLIFLPLLVIAATVSGTDPFASGIALFNQGKYDPAAKQFAAAVTRRPNDAILRITYGVALANVRKYDDAIVEFSAASRLEPNDPTIDFLLQGSYQGIGMVAQAQQSGKDAENKPKDSKLLARALEENPDNSIAHNLFGDLSQVKGRYDEAIVHYRRAAELAPGWVKPWFNLGMANLIVNPAEAARNFKKVVEIDPKNLHAQMWLGDAYSAQNDYGNALQAYNNAAGSPALRSQAQSRIGNVYLKQNQLDQAEQQFNDAVKSAPQNPAANAGLGDVYRQQNKLDASAAQYKRASDLTSQAPTQQAIVADRFANVRIDSGDCKTALDELKQILASSGRPESIQMLLNAYVRCGMLSQGISEYEAGLKKRPDDVVAMRFLAAAYARKGDARGRMEMSRKLLKSRPKESDVWNRELGIALVALGDKPGAVEAWKQGLDAAPGRDAAGIGTAAQSAGLIDELRFWYETESQTKKAAGPSLILAMIYQRDNNHLKLLEVRQRLVWHFPQNQQYRIWLGDAQRQNGKLDAARASYTRAAGMNDDVTLRATASERLKEMERK